MTSPQRQNAGAQMLIISPHAWNIRNLSLTSRTRTTTRRTRSQGYCTTLTRRNCGRMCSTCSITGVIMLRSGHTISIQRRYKKMQRCCKVKLVLILILIFGTTTVTTGPSPPQTPPPCSPCKPNSEISSTTLPSGQTAQSQPTARRSAQGWHPCAALVSHCNKEIPIWMKSTAWISKWLTPISMWYLLIKCT